MAEEKEEAGKGKKKKRPPVSSVDKENIETALVDLLFGSAKGGSTKPGDPTDMVRHAGQYNIKELIENFNELDMGRHSWAELWKNKVFADSHIFGEELKTRRLLMADNMIRQSNEIASRTLLHVPTHDFAFNRTWTFIDELAASLHAKTGVETDAIMTTLISFLTNALMNNPGFQEALTETKKAK